MAAPFSRQSSRLTETPLTWVGSGRGVGGGGPWWCRGVRLCRKWASSAWVMMMTRGESIIICFLRPPFTKKKKAGCEINANKILWAVISTQTPVRRNRVPMKDRKLYTNRPVVLVGAWLKAREVDMRGSLSMRFHPLTWLVCDPWYEVQPSQPHSPC